MKKSYFVLGLMSMILGLTACTKETVDNNVAAPEQNIITHTVAISEEAWGEDVRSSYEPGVGISLDGTESVSVYHSESGTSVLNENGELVTPYKFLGYNKGVNDGENNITITHTGTAEMYDYYFFMPYLPTSKMNGKGSSSYHRIGVQYPGENTFDANYDYMIGKPLLNIAVTEKSAGITGFKRLMAPIHLTIKDNDALLSGEKIQQVTLSFDAEASASCYLSGLFYYMHSEKYAECKESGVEAESLSNAVTADYPAGLAQNSEGNWDVWFMAHPATLPACNMTLTVTTDNYRITRTVNTGKEFVFSKDKINVLSFNVSGENAERSNVYTVDFSSISATPTTITATNGTNYNWGLQGLTYSNNVAPLPNALRLKNTSTSGEITLPELRGGATYKGIYITQNTNNITKTGDLCVKEGETTLASGSFNYYGDSSKQGGVLALTFEPTSGPLTISHSCTEALWITRITVEYEGDINAVDMNDYWSIYNAGMDITVGDLTINKTNYPDAVLLCMDSKDSEDKIRSTMQKGGVYFLDTYHNEDGSEPEDQILTLESNLGPLNNAETIIIGRWVDKQSKLESVPYTDSKGNTVGTYLTLCKAYGGGVALKNLEWTGDPLTTNLFARGSNIEADINYFIVEDCTLTAYQHLYRYTTVTKEWVVVKSIFRNNIIKMLGTDNNYNVAALPKDANYVVKCERIELIEFTNNVVICPEDAAAGKRRMLIDYGNGSAGYLYNMSNMDIVVKDNTAYNLFPSGTILVRAYRCKSALIDNNLYYVDGTDDTSVAKKGYLFGLYAHVDGTTTADTDTWQTTEREAYKVTNNFAYSYNTLVYDNNGVEVDAWAHVYNNNKPVSYTNKDNSQILDSATADGPFTSVDLTTGYLPVNTTVVTNGAGATYETKLWYNWGE